MTARTTATCSVTKSPNREKSSAVNSLANRLMSIARSYGEVMEWDDAVSEAKETVNALGGTWE